MANNLGHTFQMFYMHIDAGVMRTCYLCKYIGPFYDGLYSMNYNLLLSHNTILTFSHIDKYVFCLLMSHNIQCVHRVSIVEHLDCFHSLGYTNKL